MIEVEVRSSNGGQPWGWVYPASHQPLRDGRVLSYWSKTAQIDDRTSGVAIIIRRADADH